MIDSFEETPREVKTLLENLTADITLTAQIVSLLAKKLTVGDLKESDAREEVSH